MQIKDLKQFPEESIIYIDDGFGLNETVVDSIDSARIILRAKTELDDELEEKYETQEI